MTLALVESPALIVQPPLSITITSCAVPARGQPCTCIGPHARAKSMHSLIITAARRTTLRSAICALHVTALAIVSELHVMSR